MIKIDVSLLCFVLIIMREKYNCFLLVLSIVIYVMLNSDGR